MKLLTRLILLSAFLHSTLTAAAIPVTVGPLAEQLLDLEIRAPAMVVPANQAVITAQVTGLIEAVEQDVGAAVKQGDVLIRLDSDDAQLALDRARAELQALDAQIEQAAARLKRGEDLIESSFISDDDLLDRRTTLAVLRANRAAQELGIRSAQLALSRTRISAPYDATVVARAAQVGSLAQPGTPLLTLVQTNAREVDSDIDPRYAADLPNAQDLRLESQGRSWPLGLARLAGVIDAAARTQKGRFSFAGPPAAIGTSGEVVWKVATGLLPVPLIVQREGQLGVFVADGTTARFVALPDAQEGRPASADLPPATLLVIRGQSRLQDGDKLQIDRL